jgi:hypothetical protein
MNIKSDNRNSRDQRFGSQMRVLFVGKNAPEI